MKRKLKYLYYKMASILLGKNALDYSGRGCRYKIARLLPGRSSAVLLIIKGKVSGVGYNRWLRSNARDHKVNGWIRRRNKHTVEVLLVGKLKRVDAVVDLVKSSRFTGIDQINERWLVKEKAGDLAASLRNQGGERDGGRKFTITFAGDTSLGDNDLRRRRNKETFERLKNEPLSFFEGVTPLIKNTDHFIINVETVLADRPTKTFDKNYLKWDDPERTVEVLQNIGVTAASLANNHVMDYGSDLMLSTKKRLTAAGITCFGVGADQKEAARPLKLPLKGNYGDKNIYILNGMRASKRYWEKYSFFAGTDSPGVNSLNERRIERSIARIRKKDPESIIMICPHWQGLDYKWANDRLVQICRGFIDKGADFVIGHGPHMMQQIEQYRSGLIVYSLGNFVFNTGGEYKKRGVPPYSLIARLEIREDRGEWSTNCKLYPILSDNRRQGFRPRPVTKNEANDAYAQIATHLPDRAKLIESFNLVRDGRGWHLYQHKSEVKQNFSSRLDEMSRRETRSKCRVERGGGKMIKKVKRSLKYIYFKTLCQLFGDSDLILRNRFVQLLPGNSAVLLKVKGKVFGVGYNRWLKREARVNGVTCWVKKREVEAADVLLVGSVEKLMVVFLAAREGPGNTKINIMNERWLNKQGSLQVADAPKKNDKVFTITFAGDTSFGDYFLNKLGDKKLIDRLENNPGSFYKGLKSLTDKVSDHFIINLETVFADSPKLSLKGKKYPNWDNPQRTIPVLKNLGVTAVNLANNHTMDFGEKAMQTTCEQLKEAGIKHFGAGSNLYKASEPLKIELKGEKSTKNVYIFSAMRVSNRYSKRYREDYGFFASDATPGVNPLNLNEILLAVSDLKQKEPDALVIVCPHWQGYDYKWVSPAIVDICRSLVAAGADYVLAHGTHMANHIEKTKKGTIAYSIGNFIFVSPGRYRKFNALPYSMLVKLYITESNGEWKAEPRFYPIVTDNKETGYNVRLVNTREFLEMHAMLGKKVDNIKELGAIYERKKDQHGYFISVASKKSTDFKNIILGEKKLSEIDFNDIGVVSSCIDGLKDFHNHLDLRISEFYERLLKSRVIKSKSHVSKILLEEVGKHIKREYVSHLSARLFERKKISIKKAVSFRDIMIEQSETRRLGCPEYSWVLDRKDRAYRFADAIGLRRPKNDLRTYKLSEISEQDGPIVIKPVHSTGSRGVYIIFNKSTILSAREGFYLCSWSELIEDAFKKMKPKKKGGRPLIEKDEWMIEELILGQRKAFMPANDLKFYTFYGKVLLILECNRASPKQYCFWNSDMEVVETGKYKDKPIFEGAGFTEKELSAVTNISLQIPVPFIRLDMLKSYDGLVFGEATPRPGDFHLFNNEYDRKLGVAYRKAQARLLRDLLNEKKFEDFTSIFEI